MGKFVRFVCHYCKYDSEDIAIGQGKKSDKQLQLFRCNHCRSVGSAWVGDDDKPICSFCYDKDIDLLAEDEQSVTCPKCAEAGLLTRVNKSWD